MVNRIPDIVYRHLCFLAFDPLKKAPLLRWHHPYVLRPSSANTNPQSRRHMPRVLHTGACAEDEWRSHYKTARKGVSRTEVNVALDEYRRLATRDCSRTSHWPHNFGPAGLPKWKGPFVFNINITVQTRPYISDERGTPLPCHAADREGGRSAPYRGLVLS